MIYYDKKKNKKILTGIKKVYNSVKDTLGPNPKSAIISYRENLVIIDDGVTIANSIELDDELEKLGAKVLVEAANEMNDQIGDGTTTTIIITYHLIKKCFKWISLGKKEEDICEGIEIAKKMFLDFLDKNAKSVENINELKKVFFVSTNDKEITKLVGDALEDIGIDGLIIAEDSNDDKSSLVIKKGYYYNGGLLINDFNKNIIKEFDNPLILITDLKVDIATINKINNIVNDKNILLIVKKIDKEVAKKIFSNNIRKDKKIFVIKLVDDFNDEKEKINDLVFLTNAKYISKKIHDSLKEITINDFGVCKKVLLKNNNTTFFFEDNELKYNYKQELNDLINKEKNYYLKEQYRKRLSSIEKGVAYIKVGGSSEVETEKRKYKIIDGLKAIDAAKMNGIILGGAITNIKAKIEIMNKINKLPYRLRRGAKILLEASVLPFSILTSNSVLIKRNIINKLKKEENVVYDFFEKKWTKDEIYEPMLMLKKAIEISTSIAKTFINTKTVIIKKEKNMIEKEFL